MLVTKDRRDWWNAATNEVHKIVIPYVRTVENYQAELFDKFVKEESFYDTNSRTNRYIAGDTSRRTGFNARAIVTENLIATNIDTVAANVADTDIRARIQTDGADWSHQRTAKRLELYLDGLSTLFEVGVKCRTGFKAGAALKGTGLNKVWVNRFDEINVTPVPIDNIVIDEMECRDGKPRHLHYRDFFDREDLQAQFPEHEEAIGQAQTSGNWRLWAGYRPMQSHQVVVIESWRLPLGPYGHPRYVPGRHTLTIDGCDLLDEPYDDAFFPFSKMVWNAPVWGFYGISLAERIIPHQNLLNRRNYQINRSLDLKADPITYVHQADRNLAVQTVNQIGQIATYKSAIPTTVDHQAVGRETYESQEAIRQQASHESGVDQMMQAGSVPAGIESGAGVREVRTTRSQRFSQQEKAFERFWLDTLWLVLMCCKKLGGTKAPAILKVSKYGNQRIKWSDVDLKDLKIELSAASTISDSPHGRQQRVIELAQAGVITLDESRELMDHPDIEAKLSLYNAMNEAGEYAIEQIKDGKYVVPKPWMNLQVTIAMMQRELLKIDIDEDDGGAPPEIIEAMSDFVATAASILNPPPAPQEAGPGMPPSPMLGVPPGAPGGPPGAPMTGPAPGVGPAAQLAASASTFAPGTFAPGAV